MECEVYMCSNYKQPKTIGTLYFTRRQKQYSQEVTCHVIIATLLNAVTASVIYTL